MIRVAVTGAGASGITAALTAAGNGASVTVFERNKTPGKKLSMTGNGRCNLTHFPVDPGEYTGSFSKRAADYQEDYGPMESVFLLDRAGILTANADGYVYPMSFEAKTVSELLTEAAVKAGVVFRCGECVKDVRHDGDGFVLCTDRGESRFDRVVMASGGLARPDTGSDGLGYEIIKRLGIRVAPVLPALCPLKCRERDLKELAGVRAKGRVSLIYDKGAGEPEIRGGVKNHPGGGLPEKDVIAAEEGEIQFSADALSGICVFNLTPHASPLLKAGRKLVISADLSPDKEIDEVRQLIERLFDKSPCHKPADVLKGMMNRKLASVVAKRAGATGEGNDRDLIGRMAGVIKDMRFSVVSAYGFDRAQSSTGGVIAEETDDDLMSVRHKGLYFTGETLDICGPCGGYNLQWAWTTGLIAGKAVSRP